MESEKKINIEISRNALFKALSKTQGVVHKTTNKPFTQNVLITADTDGNCYFSATDLQIGIKERCTDVNIISDGSVSLNAKTVFDSVRSLPEGQIKLFEKENYTVKILGQHNSKFELIGMITDDFPVLNFDEDTERYSEFDIDKLSSLIDATYFSISRDEERKNLTGAYFENDRENSVIVVVTTDGFRISIAKEHAGSFKDLEQDGFIMPYKGVIELQKLLHENQEEKVVKACIDNSSITFKFKDTDILIRLLNARFPDYKRVLPEDMSSYIELKIEKNKLKESMRMVSVIAEENNAPAFFDYVNGKLNIFSEDSDVGNAFNTIELMEPVDDTFSFCAGCMYLLDILNVIDGDILLYFCKESKKKPILIKSTKNENAMYVVMPMSTDNEEE